LFFALGLGWASNNDSIFVGLIILDMSYNPAIHHRRSIRLKGYDYSLEGLYFVTLCAQHRARLFGNVVSGNMVLNDAGDMVERWYDELENKHPDIRCREMVVMPNHFHCIVENVGVGVGGHVGPNSDVETGAHVGAPLLRGRPETTMLDEQPILGGLVEMDDYLISGEHVGSPQPGSQLSDVVRWFKTMTTNEYIRGVKNLGWQPFDRKLWQRNYYEHIIRTPESHERIANYIVNNPAKWAEDKFY